MIVCSTILPQTVELVKLENNIATYKLRQNITNSMVNNDIVNSQDKIYSYDELDLQITYVENIEQLITDNFATYWTLATEQLNTKKVLEEKNKQIKDLINNHKLLEVNQETQTMINNLNQLTDIYSSTLDAILFNILPNLNTTN
jgi:predicted RND superfamily exporter protein